MTVTAETAQFLRALLEWDRQRIARVPRPLADYRQKIVDAESSLAQPVEEWTVSTRELFQTLLEVHGEMVALPRGLRHPVMVRGVGPLRSVPQSPFEQAPTFSRFREVAAEIGVLPVLEAAGSSVWRAESGEVY